MYITTFLYRIRDWTWEERWRMGWWKMTLTDPVARGSWQEVRRSGLLYCGTFVSAVHRHPPPQVIFFLLLEGHLCSPLASKSSNKGPAVTETWWSTVTWHTSELFSNCASEEKCNGSNFQHPASDNPLTGCLHSCGPSAGFVCLIHACSEGAYCLCKSCNTMALISQMHSNDGESILEWD